MNKKNFNTLVLFLINLIEINSTPRNCYEAIKLDKTPKDAYLIKPKNYKLEPFFVTCERKYGDYWTIIQRRENREVDFFQSWHEYKYGFGDLKSSFWLGLDKIHALTDDSLQELKIILTTFDGLRITAQYDEFAISDENTSYTLELLGKYNGSAGDALSYHRGMKFSTYDKNNGPNSTRNCAIERHGAWWFNNCMDSHLNGIYIEGGRVETYGIGIIWSTYRSGWYSFKGTEMLLRPVKREKRDGNDTTTTTTTVGTTCTKTTEVGTSTTEATTTGESEYTETTIDPFKTNTTAGTTITEEPSNTDNTDDTDYTVDYTDDTDAPTTTDQTTETTTESEYPDPSDDDTSTGTSTITDTPETNKSLTDATTATTTSAPISSKDDNDINIFVGNDLYECEVATYFIRINSGNDLYECEDIVEYKNKN